MGEITFTRSAIGAIHNGCGLGGITCMGSQGLLLHLEDFDVLTYPVENRTWRSVDDGATWAELPSQFTPSVWFFRSYAPAQNRVIVGTEGPNFSNGSGGYLTGVDDVMAVSEDGGDTWASGVDTATLFNPAVFDDFWQTRDIVPLDNNEVWAVGQYSRSGISTPPILRSIDGGLSFTEFFTDPASNRTINTGVYVGSGVVLTGLEWASDTARIGRSTDRGSSWSIVALPIAGTYNGVTTSNVYTLCHLGGGIVLAGGETVTLDGRHARLWRSTDSGASWSELSSQLPTTGDVLRIVKLSTTAAALIMDGGQPPYFSEDSGATWTAATIDPSNPLLSGYDFVDVAVADAGTVLGLYTKSGAGETIYVYRGVLSGFTAAAGPCTTVASTPSLPVLGEGGCVVNHRRRVGDCIDELTDDDIIRGRWQAGDRLIINRVIFSIDWDYLTQQFTKHVVYTFGDSVQKYGLRPAMRIESKGIRSTPTACGSFGSIGCGIDMLDERAFNIGARFADPPPMLNLEVFYRKHLWEPSDIICVTSAFVPNIVTGVRGIVAEPFEVINIQQQFAPEGKIILTLLDVQAITLPDPAKLVAEDEVDLLNRLREQDLRLTEVPLRSGDLRRARSEVARFQRGKTQEGVPPSPAEAPRREILAGIGRGTFPRVP